MKFKNLWIAIAIVAFSHWGFAQLDEDFSELENEIENLEQTELEVGSDDTDDLAEVTDDDDDFVDDDEDEDLDDFAEDEEVADEDDEELDELLEEDEDEDIAAEDDELGDEIDEDLQENEEEVEQTAEAEEQEPVFDEPEIELIDEPVVEEPVELSERYEPDEPNLDYEKQLHQIYQDYYSQPLSDAEWLGVTGDRLVEKYSIQEGDTLWDVSDTFFGDGFYWSKVWSLNSGIENPHIVEPGNALQFQLGNLEDAPSMEVTTVPAPDPALFVTKQARQQEQQQDLEFGDEDEIEIPPPLKEPTPVVQNIPPSLPGLSPKVPDEYSESGFAKFRRPLLGIKRRKVVHHFITENEPNGIGRIIETDLGTKTAGPFQHVFVQVKKDMVRPGEKFRVISTIGDLDVENTIAKGQVEGVGRGVIVEVMGEIEIVNKVESSIEENDVYRALVKKVLSPIPVGGLVQDGRVESVAIDKKGEQVYIEGNIVGGEGTVARNLYGMGEIVFINRGSSDGMAPGYILSIRHNRALRRPNSPIFDDGQVKGFVKVVDVSENFSTAMIVETVEDIFTGDFVGNDSFVDASSEAEENFDQADIEEELETEGLVSEDMSEDAEDSEESVDFEEDEELEDAEMADAGDDEDFDETDFEDDADDFSDDVDDDLGDFEDDE